MTETTANALWGRGWARIATVTGLGLLIAGGVLLVGCAGPTKSEPVAAEEKPVTPEAAFNEICNRSLGDDLSFVKSRLSSGLLDQLGGAQAGPAVDQAIRAMMTELRTCRAVSVMEKGPGGKVTLQVARGLPGVVRLLQIDLVQDAKGNWILAGKLHDEQPLPKPEGPK